MRSNRLALVLLLSATVGCGKDSASSSSASSSGAGSSDTTVASDANVMRVTVNGSLCSDNSYIDKPCVQVTVCTPGTGTCQTIHDILLDTGSYGLRIFKDALTVSLTQVSSGTGELAECMYYGDGTTQWGPVQTAGVVLGGEAAVDVPIQVIDSTYMSTAAASLCKDADESSSAAGFNGILGVGVFAQDCGGACVKYASNGYYFKCSGSSCAGTTAALSQQVQNPVAALDTDNNGVIVELPSVADVGAGSAEGSLILGIGTRSNNAFSAGTTLALDASAEFTTTFGGITYFGFLDTGSNGLWFTPPSSVSSLTVCDGDYWPWFCPASTVDFSATNTDAASGSSTVSFRIANIESLLVGSPTHQVFSGIGGTLSSGSLSSGYFDWGLPFHLGRSVYVGLEGTTANGGAITGPYAAY